MNPQRYQQVKAIFLEACEHDGEGRAAYLDQACGDDEALRAEVERMLDRDAAPLEALDTAATRPGGMRRLAEAALEEAARQPGAAAPLPERIGPYRITRVLGEGGMGIVYEAEQDQPRRKVALKVIRGAVAAGRTLSRFEFEVQVLGQLEHPGIARIYEAGTAEQRGARQPFFAMEFIDGPPITEFAMRQKLDTRQRVALMARVCDAVQYAHQKGVIHRDLKPANILVVEESAEGSRDLDPGAETRTASSLVGGAPKVLDFGVARATDADLQRTTMQTDAGQIVGTVPYMSPEQIAGEVREVDARSDVYSLGVVLFELLAGRLPFDLGDLTPYEAARVVRETEPKRLGAINAACRGDVETIVAKAMEKDKTRRYETAAQLGADLRRYLRDEPILARPASTMYQLRKLARRNKPLVAGVIVAILGLIAGTVFASWQAFVATRQRDRAVHAENEVRLTLQRAVEARAEAIEQRDRAILAERQTGAVYEFIRYMLSSVDPRRTPDRDITMVEVLDAASDTVSERYEGDPLVEAVIQETLGDTYQNLGKYDRAERHARRVLEIARDQFGDDAPEANMARTNLALVCRDLGRYDEALELATRARDGLVRDLGPDDPDAIDAVQNVALVHVDQGRYDQAIPLLEDVVERRRRVEGETSDSYLRAVSALGSTYGAVGRFDEAETRFREALAGRIEKFGTLHPDVLFTRNDLAHVYQQAGRLDEAEEIMRQLVDLAPVVLGEDHPVTYTFMNNLAGIYDHQDRHAESEPLFRRVYEFARSTLGETHPSTFVAMNNLAGAYQALGRYDEAEPLYLEALDGRRAKLGDDHPETITSINNLGFLYRRQGRFDEAEPLYREAMQRFEGALGPDHPNTLIAVSNLGTLYNDMGLYSEAEPINRRVMEGLAAALPPQHWLIGLSTARYAASLTGLERFDEAEPLLLEAAGNIEAALGTSHERYRYVAGELVRLYERWEKPERAATWRARLPGDEDALD